MTLVGFSPRLRPTSASFDQDNPPPLSFSAFLLVKARVWDWGPHHTSSTPGRLPPFPPLVSWEREHVGFVCWDGGRLLSAVSALSSRTGLSPDMSLSLRSSPSARSFYQCGTVGAWIQYKRQLIDFSVTWFAAGGGAWAPRSWQLWTNAWWQYSAALAIKEIVTGWLRKIAAVVELNRFSHSRPPGTLLTFLPRLVVTNKYYLLCLQVQSFTWLMGGMCGLWEG